MRVSINCLLIIALLQGCTLEVKESPEPAQAEQESERLLNERRMQAQLHRSRALELEQQGDFLNAAGERVSYLSYLDRDAEISADTVKIWENLNRADKNALVRRYRSDPQAFSGWLELAFIRRTMLADPGTLERALASWQENYPAHPANPAIVGQVREAGRLFNRQVEKIALLLPMRGALREAAEAVRDGFISAWYNSGVDRPPIRIYEANSLNIEQAYAQAVAEGADFIVGPLEKQALAKLSARAGLSVPTLALNQLQVAPDMAAGAGADILPALMQFSLSPEDEARQVAERASADGHGRALVIMPGDEWGRRLHDAFRDGWSASGGVILETTVYEPRTNDFGAPVKQMLNVDGSEFRTRRLRQALSRSLNNRARRRQDADMIFMAAFPIAGRQIIPQLRFHGAGRLPVYATSHIFTGSVNPAADADMNGVVFPDLPWILAPSGQISSIKTLIDHNFKAASTVYQRLHAFGADAFNLIPHLARLAYEDEAEFRGATGTLSMSDDGRITRKLPWGKIVNGKPELLGGS
ncbi:MAG: penicillin-binding protein activator [Gammaproteobacteria bacterium]|nr:penicillin-binding protein activator [Gammaproteobacteria bacterium]